jgi:hypothetical protein
MAEPHMFPNGRETDEAKIARIEAHHYHLWRQLNALQEEIRELKKDRAALLRKVGGWAAWVLVALLSAVVSKGSTLGYLSQKLLEMIGSSSG